MSSQLAYVAMVRQLSALFDGAGISGSHKTTFCLSLSDGLYLATATLDHGDGVVLGKGLAIQPDVALDLATRSLTDARARQLAGMDEPTLPGGESPVRVFASMVRRSWWSRFGDWFRGRA